MRFLLIISIILMLFGCNRKVQKNTSETEEKKQKVSVVKDTAQSETEVVQETTEYYGDSLTGSLYFDLSDLPDMGTTEDIEQTVQEPKTIQVSDSIESAGLKVKGTLEKLRSGAYKLKLRAVSKPVSKTDKITLKEKEYQSRSETNAETTDTKSKNRRIDKETTGASTAWLYWLLFLLIIIAVIVYFIKKVWF